MIIAGWPDDIKDVPKAFQPYHGQCDLLTVEDGIILHREAIIIPTGERKKVLEQIHHSTSSQRNLKSNGQAESTVKIVKGLITHVKCSGQDPYFALLAYRTTQVDSHL